MKSPFATALMTVAAMSAAQAQTPAAKPKPPAAARPAVQAPADTARAMAQAERLAIQSDLAWTGHYNGVINGEVSDRMIAAIKAFQKDQGGKDTGVLNAQERRALAEAARKAQDHVGWKLVTDPATGARLGVPAKLVPQMTSDASGTRWTSTIGTISVELSRRKEANATLAAIAEREKKAQARKTDYSAVRPDFFVLSGLQGLKKFYIRGQLRDDEVRILTILYDQATEGLMAPVTVAMSSAFNPFPGAAASGPPPRRRVEYSTGIVAAADGAILAEREATEACQSIVLPGRGPAVRVADDAAHGLALLRIYGTERLTPLAMAGAPATSAVTITGIADPQSQGGRSDVTRIAATAAPAGGEIMLTPEPGLGLSGAAVLDGDGRFAGLARLKPAVVAGSATSLPMQAVLVPAEAVRDFLKANGVAVASGPADAKASVLRVVCVRK